MEIPSRVLKAAGDPGGGKLVIVMGAGCSIEDPSGLPDSRSCSLAMWKRLRDDGVLENGDCVNPEDLSCLADAVYAKCGSQSELVNRLGTEFRFAAPNEGSMLAAALLREGVASNIVTLNFDLTMTHALTRLGADPKISVLRRPGDHENMGAHNLVYLHRNVEAEDPETLILRTAALEEQWQSGWEEVIAQIALATPVVIFAGLGTEVGVLVASATRLRSSLGDSVTLLQVDIGAREDSVYAAKLKIDEEHFISTGWSNFMRALGERVAQAQAGALKQAAQRLVKEHGVGAEEVEPLLKRLAGAGLLYLGELRAKWALDPQKPYCNAGEVNAENVGDLLLGIAMLERLTNCEARFVDDGLLELVRDGSSVALVAVGSGLGIAAWTTAEQRLRAAQGQHTALALHPTFGLLAHVKARPEAIAPPADIVAAKTPGSIVTGPGVFPIFELEQLRSEPSEALSLVRAA
jgi:hypothetical protein